MKKKFILGLAILFSIGLSTTACESNNPQKETDGLAEYKEDAKAKLTAYIETLEPDDYSDGNWALVQAAFMAGKKAIDAAADNTEVDTALNAAFKEIHLVDYEGRDFVLTISVEETTVKHGEDFVVDVCLKNQSGEGEEIFYYYSPFIPYIANWTDTSFDPFIPPQPEVLTIENNESFHETRHLRSMGYSDPSAETWSPIYLPIGNHELKFRVLLTQKQQEIEIWSNTVMLTVQ